MCQSGRLEDLQQALSRGHVSPFVTDERGRTLIHHAAISANVEMCLLLIRLGIDPGQMCSDGSKPMHLVGRPRQHDPPGIKEAVLEVLRLMVTATDHITVDDISRFFSIGYGGPPEGVDLVLSQATCADEMNRGEQTSFTLLHNALRFYGCGNKDWIPSIRKLLRERVDIHAPRPSEGRICGLSSAILTPLDYLLLHTSHPSDGDLVAKDWLTILQEERYDVVAYLQEELALHRAQQMFTADECQIVARKLVFHIGDPLAVSWDWWVDPLSDASLVRSEFRNLNFHCGTSDGYYTVSCLWKWDKLWPFGYTAWSQDFDLYGNPDWVWWLQRADLHQTRVARRAKKKQLKLARAQGTYRPNHVPGAWVD